MKFNLFSIPALLFCTSWLAMEAEANLAAAIAAQVAAAKVALPPPAVAAAPAAHSWIEFEKLTDNKLTFDIKHYQKKLKFRLKKQPKGKVTVFLQGNNLQFDRCAVHFDSKDWNKEKEVFVTAAPYFTDSATDRNLNIRFAIQAIKDAEMNKKEDTLAVVREKGSGAICQSSGDPHYKSFANRAFDFQGCGGPFTLVQSKRLTVQFTTKKWVNTAFVNSAVAIRYNDVVFVLCADKGLTTFDPNGVMKQKGINGKPLIEVCQNKRGTDTKFRDFRFHFPDGTAIDAAINTAHMEFIDMTVKLPCHMTGKVSGICGKYESPPNNQFFDVANKVAPNESAMGESFRVKDPHNLFSCALQGKCNDLRPQKMHAASTCIIPPLKDTELPDNAGYEVAPPGYTVLENFDPFKEQVKIEPVPKHLTPNPAPTEALKNAARKACHATFKQYENDNIADLTVFRNNCIEDVLLSGQFGFVDQHKADYLEYVRTLTKPLARDPMAAVAAAAEAGTAFGNNLSADAKAAAGDLARKLQVVNAHGLGRKACPNDCSGNGQCSVHGCLCKPNFTGDSCQIDLREFAVPRKQAYTTGVKPKPRPIMIPPAPIKYTVQKASRQIIIPKGGYVTGPPAGAAHGDDPFAEDPFAEDPNAEEGAEENFEEE